MLDLERLVDELRDTMKSAYLKDRNAIWDLPFAGFFDSMGGGGWANYGAGDDGTFTEYARAKLRSSRLEGIVVGRMVAKYSQVIKDIEGNPQMLEKAILVSGRLFSTGQTYVSITKIHEHQDLRHSETGEPLENKPYVPGVTSPDKVQEIIDDQTGALSGFLSMQFGKEEVFDSRRGQTCQMDPIIAGVMGSNADRAAAAE